MSVETPQLQWPVKVIEGGSRLGFVEQDSPIEIAQCVGLVLVTPVGGFIDAPELGTEDPTFTERGVSNSALEEAVRRWEPRALLGFTLNELREHLQRVFITVEGEE